MAGDIKYGILMTLKDRVSGGLGKLQKGLEGFRDRISGASRVARRGLLALGGAVAAVGYAAMQQESADRRLADALRTTGQYSEENYRGFKKLASAIQEVTVYGDEQLQMMMAQALNLGISSDRTEEATKGAIGLATALDMDLNTAMRYTALAMQGEFTVLQRYVPALRTAETEAEKMAIVQKLMAAGFQQAKGEAETAAGVLKQIKGVFGDLLQQIGFTILGVDDWATALKRVKARIKEAIEWVRGLSRQQIENIKRWVKWTAIVLGVVAVLGPLCTALLGLLNVVGLIIPAIKALGVAMMFLVAHPVAALMAGLAALGVLIITTRGHIADLTDEMQRNRQAGDKLRVTDRKLMDELVRLAAKQFLNAREMARASQILGTLEKRYGMLGVTLDKTTGSIAGVSVAQAKLNRLMIEAARAQVDLELDEYRRNLAAIREEIGSIGVGAFLTFQQQEKLTRAQEKYDAELASGNAIFARRRVLLTQLSQAEKAEVEAAARHATDAIEAAGTTAGAAAGGALRNIADNLTHEIERFTQEAVAAAGGPGAGAPGAAGKGRPAVPQAVRPAKARVLLGPEAQVIAEEPWAARLAERAKMFRGLAVMWEGRGEKGKSREAVEAMWRVQDQLERFVQGILDGQSAQQLATKRIEEDLKRANRRITRLATAKT